MPVRMRYESHGMVAVTAIYNVRLKRNEIRIGRHTKTKKPIL